jgi:hypothetical protein
LRIRKAKGFSHRKVRIRAQRVGIGVSVEDSSFQPLYWVVLSARLFVKLEHRPPRSWSRSHQEGAGAEPHSGQRLGYGIHWIVMGGSRKGGAFFDHVMPPDAPSGRSTWCDSTSEETAWRASLQPSVYSALYRSAEISSKLRPSPSSNAGFPVKSCHRFTAMST